ncbi:hypothetical protein TDB9533_03824 [Thalassocella blandensis]|nr:hypothetical protein TDB9533_03824 [Thalassocella blandensis]
MTTHDTITNTTTDTRTEAASKTAPESTSEKQPKSSGDQTPSEVKSSQGNDGSTPVPAPSVAPGPEAAAVPYVVTLKYIPTPTPPAKEEAQEKSHLTAGAGQAEGAPAPTGNVILSSDTSLIDKLVIASNIIPIASLNPQTPEIITITNSFYVFAEQGFITEGKTLSTAIKSPSAVKAGDSLQYADNKISVNESGPADKRGVVVKNNSSNPITLGLAQVISTTTAPSTDAVPVTAVYVPPWQSILLPLDIAYEMWVSTKGGSTPPAAGTLFDTSSVQDNTELKLSAERPAALVILAGETLVNGVG